MSGVNSAGCGRLREGVPDGDGRYSALNQTACIRESMAHLTTKRRREFGAAREPNAGSATCNGGKCREARREAWRWRCSREELAPEGNLVIVERGEDKADAPQASRPNAARHFTQIRKHSRRNTTQHRPHRFDLQQLSELAFSSKHGVGFRGFGLPTSGYYCAKISRRQDSSDALRVKSTWERINLRTSDSRASRPSRFSARRRYS